MFFTSQLENDRQKPCHIWTPRSSRAPVEKWRAGETVWDGFMAPSYVVFLVRKLKSLGLVVDGIPASFCGLQGFAAACQRPFHRLHKWKQSLCLFLSMVCITAQRDYGFLVCKQLSKITTFILSRFFRSFISTSTNSPKSLS